MVILLSLRDENRFLIQEKSEGGRSCGCRAHGLTIKYHMKGQAKALGKKDSRRSLSPKSGQNVISLTSAGVFE